jgi:hypothetical protein
LRFSVSGAAADPSQWGPPPGTTLADSLQSSAMLLVGIRASETGMTIDAQELVTAV